MSDFNILKVLSLPKPYSPPAKNNTVVLFNFKPNSDKVFAYHNEQEIY